MDGTSRELLYLVASTTGPRAAELSSLSRPASFDLHEGLPPVTVEAASRSAKIWPGNWWQLAAEILRRGLAAAGVAYRTDSGEVLTSTPSAGCS